MKVSKGPMGHIVIELTSIKEFALLRLKKLFELFISGTTSSENVERKNQISHSNLISFPLCNFLDC